MTTVRGLAAFSDKDLHCVIRVTDRQTDKFDSIQAGRRIGSRAVKLLATHTSPSNCNSTDYWQFSLGVGLRQMLLLPEF